MDDPRRFWRTTLLFLLLFLLWRPVAAQDTTPFAPPLMARLSLDADASHDTAQLTLYVIGDKAPANTPAEAQKVLRKLFSEIVHGQVGPVEYETYSDDEDESSAPTNGKPTPITSWQAVASVGRDVGGPIRRTVSWSTGDIQQTGDLYLQPLKAFLRPYDIENVGVAVYFDRHGEPLQQVSGLEERTELRPRRNTMTKRIRYRQVFPVDSLPAEPVHIAFGFRGTDLAWTYLPLIVVMLIPLLLAFLLQRRAILAHVHLMNSGRTVSGDEAAEAIWRGCFRLLYHGTVPFTLVWMFLVFNLGPDVLPRWYFSIDTLATGVAFGFLDVTIPIAIVQTLTILILRPVFQRLRNMEISAIEVVLQTGGQLGFVLFPLLFTFIGVACLVDVQFIRAVMTFPNIAPDARYSFLWKNLVQAESVHRALGWFALVSTSRWLFTLGLPLINRIQPLLLTSGPIYDRLTALSKTAGVTVKQLIYTPAGWHQAANAFALPNNIVVLTDRLLKELSRDEVDGIIAHELAHLKHRHPRLSPLIALFGFVAFGGIMIFLSFRGLFSTQSYVATMSWLVPAGLGCGMLVMRFVSRYFEKVADTTAIGWTGNPRALITGLTRLSRINGTPSEWGRWEKSLMTHPGTQSRAAYLGKTASLSESEVEALIAQAYQGPPPESERYPLPVGSVPTLIFSRQYALRSGLKNALVYVAIVSFVPVIFAVLARAMGNGNTILSGELLFSGGVLTLGGILLHQKFLSQRDTVRLERRLRERLRATGALPLSDENVFFVGIAPGGLPRFIDGRACSTYGYIVLEPDALRFVGEEFMFSVPRPILLQPSDAGVFPGWFPQPRIQLSWPDPTAGNVPTEQTSFVVHRLGSTTLREMQRAGRELLVRLREWHAAYVGPQEIPDVLVPIGDTNITPEGLLAPRLSLNSGMLATEIFRPRMVLTSVRNMMMPGIAIALLSNLPLVDVAYVASVPIVIVLAERFVMVRQLKTTNHPHR